MQRWKNSDRSPAEARTKEVQARMISHRGATPARRCILLGRSAPAGPSPLVMNGRQLGLVSLGGGDVHGKNDGGPLLQEQVRIVAGHPQRAQ
jgi:hypothetical protein